MKFHKSLKFRMNLWYWLILAVTILLFAIITFYLLDRQPSHTNHEMVKLTEFIVKVAPTGSMETVPNSDQYDSFYKPLFAYSLKEELVDKIKAGPSAPFELTAQEGILSFDQGIFITRDLEGPQDVWLYYRPVKDNPGFYEVLAVTQSKAPVLTILAAYKQAIYVAIPVTLIFAGLLGYILIRRLLKPLDAITSAVRGVSENHLDRKIVIKNSSDELGSLSMAFNQTLERLKGAFDLERQFTSEVSHELRTPLTIIQSEATLALTRSRNREEYQKSLESISREINHMSSMVRRLLLVARMENGKEELVLAEVNLGEIINDIVLVTGSLCEGKGLRLHSDLQKDVLVRGDEVKLREMILNLVDNAIKYTPEGGDIWISLRSGGSQALVTIKDTGAGISEKHLPHIFERFYRADHSAGSDGSGLGLTICRHIVELHKGKIEVESKPSEGTTFTVALPVDAID